MTDRARSKGRDVAGLLALGVSLGLLGLAAGWTLTLVAPPVGTPLIVVGDSMAPFVVGPTWAVRCGDCGWSFAVPVTTEAPPSTDRLVCGNCGGRDCVVDPAVRPASPLFEGRTEPRPHRGSLVTTMLPGEADGRPGASIKRIVGLPGERVSIVGGDVLINGRILIDRDGTRSDRTLPVHDDRFRPADPTRSPRWEPATDADRDALGLPTPGDDSGPAWRRSAEGWAVSPTTRDAVAALIYRQTVAFDTPLPRGTPVPILDVDPFNVGDGRTLNPVRDWWLMGRLAASGSGRVDVTCRHAEGTIRARWDVSSAAGGGSANATVCLTFGGPWAGETSTGPAIPVRSELAAGVAFAVGRCDGRAFLEIDGVEVARLSLGDRPWPLATNAAVPTEPVAIVAVGAVDVRLTDLVIERDVYELLPPPVTMFPRDADGAWTVGPDEVFVLGDNPARSWDSRQVGPVAAATLRRVISDPPAEP